MIVAICLSDLECKLVRDCSISLVCCLLCVYVYNDFSGSITKLFSSSPSGKGGDMGGITLVSMKPLNTDYSPPHHDSFPQASTMSLDSGLRDKGHSRG